MFGRTTNAYVRTSGVLVHKSGFTMLVLAIVTSWWLILLGVAAVVAAWTYTGGRHPYGYRGLGEVAVFAFFGLAAVVGTAYVQVDRLTWLEFVAHCCTAASSRLMRSPAAVTTAR